MVFVAVTSSGLADALGRAVDGDAIWCGSDTISEQAYKALAGAAVSRFNYSLADPLVIEGAVATIEEHHPGQTIWFEAATRS